MHQHMPAAVIGDATLYHADCRDVLRAMADNSIDSVVTDPPYALVSIVKRFGGKNAAPAKDGDVYARASAGFMGKQWDTGEVAFATEFWAEVLRVLKPGGHVVAFSGTRTYHRMVVAIEDAGFEIRDQLGWLYGSGFPKSHDVSKGIDKAAGAEREVVGVAGRSATKTIGAVGHVGGEYMDTAPATDAARQWQGWGTALKPAWEPIVLARKPLIGTVAENVLQWGAGAINVDGCRVDGEDAPEGRRREGCGLMQGSSFQMPDSRSSMPAGRWPANIVHDGSDEVVAAFPVPSPEKSGGRSTGRNFGQDHGDTFAKDRERTGHDDNGGSASRFFYCAKASRRDREEGLSADSGRANTHPTVKPTSLMQWLCRLVTPPGGVVLDPFLGSGSTGKAALLEGFRFIGIEREDEYMPIAAARIGWAAGRMDKEDAQAATAAPAAPAVAPQQPAANDNEPDLFSAAA